MAVRVRLRSGDRAQLPSSRRTPGLLGTCALGVPGTVYTFDVGDDVVGTLGPGKLTAAILYLQSAGGSRVVASPTEPTYYALPAVTHRDASGGTSPTGPAVSIALTGATGPHDDAPLKLRITSDGGLGAAMVDVAYDGDAYVETFVLPSERPAVLRGTEDISAGAAVNGLTVVLTAPAAASLLFAADYASSADVVAAFNELAAAAPVDVRMRVYEDPGGEELPEFYTLAVGVAAELTIDDGTSTALAALGFSSLDENVDAAGAAATRSFPALGITATFAAGDYTAAEAYAWPIQGPRSSVAALSDAAIAAHDEFDDHPFGFLATVEDFASNTAAATALTTLAQLAATWTADETSPIFVDVVVGTAFHASPSAVRATHRASVAAFDADLLAELDKTTANLGDIAVDDIYIGGSALLMPGTFRRSATWAGAAKRAAAVKIAANPGDGLVIGGALVGPGRVLARDDARASTKLGGLAGPGVWALKSTSGGARAPKFGVCATRAGATSRLRSPGAGVAVGLEIARVVFQEVEFYEGETWQSDSSNPKAASTEETDPRRDHLRAVLNDVLFPKNQDPNVSTFDVTLEAPTALDDGIAAVVVTYNPLIEIETVTVTITATGAVIQGAPA